MRSHAHPARRSVGAGLLAAAGCLGGRSSPPRAAAEPAFDPTSFFAGRTRGEGTLRTRFRGDRTLRVEGTGVVGPDGALRLDQTVTWGDGEVERRVWRLRRVDATHYAATLSDAKGGVRAESNGNLFHIRYLLRHPWVYMEQWLTLQPDARTAANLARVTVLGVPWARLDETITRLDGGP